MALNESEQVVCEAIDTMLRHKVALGLQDLPEDAQQEEEHSFQYLHEQINEMFAIKAAGLAHHDGVCAAFDPCPVFANTLPINGGSSTDPNGDANGDGVVSAGDYAAVQANFGNTVPATTVPEPATLLILAFGVLIRPGKS